MPAPADLDPSLSPWHRLGAYIRHWRELRDETQTSLGKKVLVEGSLIGRYERAAEDRRPSLELVQRMDDVLQARGRLVALHPEAMANSPRSDSPKPAAPHDADDMDLTRRTLLVAAAMGVAGALPMHAIEQVRHSVSASLGGDQLSDWQETVWEYGHMVIRQPPQAVLADLALDAAALQQAINRRPVGDSKAWARVQAGMAFLMARCLGYCLQPREARHWWQAARRAADSAGDIDLQAAARGWEATQALYAGRPHVVVLQRADDALQLARGRACAGAAEGLAMRAQAAAVAGHAGKALTELQELERLVDRLPDAVLEDRETAFGWPHTRFLHTRSYVLARIGHARAASAAADEAIGAYPTWAARAITQVELHRAVVAIREGHTEDGISHARSVLRALPPEQHTMFVRETANDVLRTVPLAEAHRPPVLEYRQLLALSPVV
ncbi:helix-turn-helix transcriptional regulator [Microbispora sp. NBRC 16548]|uniref:helix-turn-helix domain-containing protein n=1 Tax=Microbispora sp. NBRC 16548 TaxID=3030994 RepID=UPI0016227F86|nr:helix-turn-helix transcriptional regulator [Microbispora sp. NBRC 16548]GLX06655.1 hypothetical protein Misp03_35820 [Microbispora sp. NBRC 16548]